MENKEENKSNVLFLVKFTLYQTKTKFFIVGENYDSTCFQVLKIDRTVEDDLDLVEDETIYSKTEISKLLATLDDGNRNCGGISKVLVAWGICGFIRFTCGYYISFITKRSTVALLGGHYIYHINDTKLIPITHESVLAKKPRSILAEESRYLNIFQTLDLNKTFYFSYSYDITHTLQHNLTTHLSLRTRTLKDCNEMFVWNYNLLNTGVKCLKNQSKWCIPIVHGFIDQANISVYGRSIYITLIARRSRHFAGARFFKRGVNSKGYVANDVESEQIVSEMLTTSFYTKDMKLNPKYTSYVQNRGSIPLFWSQDPNNMSPKPPIKLDIVDPFFSATALHFDNMFKRYRTPCIVVNLIKSRERIKRESILLEEYTQAICYLNQFLPEDKKIKYIAWDMSRASKTRGQDVILTLENIADDVLKATGFFHSKISNILSKDNAKRLQLQEGICRTNCIDCLDRTNAAQFVIAKKALGYQLFALGIIKEPVLNYDTDAINLLTEMYHDHGDTIALQYGGSHLVRYFKYSGTIITFLSYKYWYIPLNIDHSLIKNDFYENIKCNKSIDFDQYWSEYYKPQLLSTLDKIFAYKINSTLRYIPVKYTSDKYFEFSPFVIRTLHGDVLEENKISKEKSSTRATSSYKKHKRRFTIQKILKKEENIDIHKNIHEHNKTQKIERFQGLDTKNGPFLFPPPSEYRETIDFLTNSMLYKKEEYNNYLFRSYHIESLQIELFLKKSEYSLWVNLENISDMDKIKTADEDLDLYIQHCSFPETLYDMKASIYHLIENSPPGEVNDVLNDIRILVNNDKVFFEEIVPFLTKYNMEQFTNVRIPDSDNEMIISKFNSDEEGWFFDPILKKSFKFDHINLKVLDVKSYETDVKTIEKITSLLTPLLAYLSEHFPSNVSYGVFPCKNDTYNIIIVGNKYNPVNFWNGRWRSFYQFTESSLTITGTLLIDVHYYEDGNVCLTTKRTFSFEVKSLNCFDIITTIAEEEKKYQEELNIAFSKLNDYDFKNLRRQLPITKQKMNWENINTLRIGQDVTGRSQTY
ncbi:hypothetical protein PMAC_002720 [Pneumocystis sp. 'macacae']|nr:hypothetical protein PMAC_002720 [Pneumocystis sp. 'macacae']